jgi:hypothetical protein
MGKDLKVSAVMTAGRYETVFARNAIEAALAEVGLRLMNSQGVFYGQCMQRMFNEVCDIGADVVLTIDGDSIFTGKHINRLLSIIAQEEKIDALASLQLRRGKSDLLGFCRGQSQFEWSGYPIKLTSAHFGLTVLRVDKLKTVAKPWFFSRPDKNGDWSDERIDDDVWFWKQWEEAGHSLFMDPGCRIGHLEEMVATFDENLKPTHVYPADWK